MNLYEVYSLYDITPVRGAGSYIYDKTETEYLDFYGGHAVISIGHSHPHYVNKISAQVQKLGFYSNSIVNPLQQELADLLEQVSRTQSYELFLINSGAEANENALKLASFYRNRKKIIALNNSFHGRTSAAINVTHTGQKYQSSINQGIDVIYFSGEDIEGIVLEIQKKDSAAIIIEAIQGVGGLDMISHDNLRKIQQICESTDTLLIMDEVQCGYGRSGKFFCWQDAGIRPDLITMAKGMGNGFPIGGVLIDAVKMPPVMNQLGTTYGGNHLACAAGIAVLEVIRDEKLIENAARMGEILKSELLNIPQIIKIKGKGLMLGAEFDFPIGTLRKNLVFEQKLFTGSSSNSNLLRLLPSLAASEKEIELFLTKLKRGLKSI